MNAVEQVPPVIVRVPAHLGEVEVLVRHVEGEVEVDIRPAGSRVAWSPLAHWGGTFDVVR